MYSCDKHNMNTFLDVEYINANNMNTCQLFLKKIVKNIRTIISMAVIVPCLSKAS